MATGLSSRDLSRYAIGAVDQPLSLRQTLRHETGPVRLSTDAGFSVLEHNLALLPVLYKGTNRHGVIGQIVGEIVARLPTIVGLCEVWVESERDEIRNALAAWYPYYLQGPGGLGSSAGSIPIKASSGGLLLLSSVPIEASNSMIYAACAAQDCAAAKGILHMRTADADIFLSHTQDILAWDGRDALYAQIDEMNAFVESHRDPARSALIMGDLNIPGENAGHYRQLLDRLGGPIDCWTVLGNAPDAGYTEIVDSNFYDDSDDRPEIDERLDFVLLKAGTTRVPLVGSTEILRFTHDGRYISDHFGLSTRFDIIATID